MSADNNARPRSGVVQAVLGDDSRSAAVIECAAALAQAQQRVLSLVYVESTLAWQAAALPAALALAHLGAAWSPFAPEDVERGWRAQSARLRALAGTIALRHAVAWSLHTVRGELPRVAVELSDATDLLLVAAGAALRPLGWRAGAGAVTWLRDEGNDAAALGQRAASNLAQALRVPLRVLTAAPGDDAAFDALLRSARAAETWVLPRGRATPRRLAGMPCAVLLVG